MCHNQSLSKIPRLSPTFLQTTVAACLFHPLEVHTVLQALLTHTSTLPSYTLDPPTRRTLPVAQLLALIPTATKLHYFYH